MGGGGVFVKGNGGWLVWMSVIEYPNVNPAYDYPPPPLAISPLLSGRFPPFGGGGGGAHHKSVPWYHSVNQLRRLAKIFFGALGAWYFLYFLGQGDGPPPLGEGGGGHFKGWEMSSGGRGLKEIRYLQPNNVGSDPPSALLGDALSSRGTRGRGYATQASSAVAAPPPPPPPHVQAHRGSGCAVARGP